MRIPASDKALLLAESITALKNGLKEGDPQNIMIMFPIDDQDFSTRGRIKSSSLKKMLFKSLQDRKNSSYFCCVQDQFLRLSRVAFVSSSKLLDKWSFGDPKRGWKKNARFCFFVRIGFALFHPLLSPSCLSPLKSCFMF